MGKKAIIFESEKKIDPNSMQAKAWPEIANTHCHIAANNRLARRRYIRIYGEIGKGLEVCHKCDNNHCVNFEHLFIETHQENQHDMVKKCRSTKGYKHTEEAKLKIKKTWENEERKRALKIKNNLNERWIHKDCKMPEATKEKISKSMVKVRQLQAAGAL